MDTRYLTKLREAIKTDKKDPLWRKFDLQKDEIRKIDSGTNYFDKIVKTDEEPAEYYWLK